MPTHIMATRGEWKSQVTYIILIALFINYYNTLIYNTFDIWKFVFTSKYIIFLFKMYMYFIDPHVRIAGLPEDVKAAKMQVMSVLDDRVRIFFILPWTIFYNY